MLTEEGRKALIDGLLARADINRELQKIELGVDPISQSQEEFFNKVF